MARPVLRDEQPPDEAVILVRGGILAADSARKSAVVSMEQHGFLGISVYAAAGMTVRDLVQVTPQLDPARYRQLRSSTAGLVRAAGFRLLATLDWPHFDIELTDLSDETLGRLGSCFGPPFPNPGP